MAMMISKFHKLIQSKLVWYILLGFIVVAFTFVGFSGSRQEKKRPSQKVVGELFGKKVMAQEYRQAYQNTYLWYVLSSGNMPQMTDEMAEALDHEAWQRLVSIRKAKADQITVSDAEIVKQIQRLAAFQGESGGFDVRAYNLVLKHLRTTSQQIEAILREQILIHKLMIRPIQAALISPSELTQAYYLYTDRFVLNYALLPREQIAKNITVSREEAEILFNENIEAFRMPSKVHVSYVEWKINDFLAQVEAPEGAALEFYNKNLENYRIETTNEFEIASYKPFENVEKEITDQICETLARRAAAEEATSLVAAIAPQAEGATSNFEGAAAKAGLTIKTLPAFGQTDTLPAIDETAPFRQAASRLQNDAYSSFSDAVIGKDSVYVISLEKRYPSFLPSFGAVETSVMEAAQTHAISEAVSERAIELQKTLTAALNEGNTIQDILKPYNLNIETTEEFDITTDLTNDYANILIPICLNAKQGELCELVPTEDGILITYVAERKSIDAELGLPSIRQELIAGLSRNLTQQLTTDWQASLLSEANFKNLMTEK